MELVYRDEETWEYVIDSDFFIEFQSTNSDNLPVSGQCNNLRAENNDPLFPQPAALRSPIIFKCEADLPESDKAYSVVFHTPSVPEVTVRVAENFCQVAKRQLCVKTFFFEF